jgi:hypothetical protein
MSDTQPATLPATLLKVFYRGPSKRPMMFTEIRRDNHVVLFAKVCEGCQHYYEVVDIPLRAGIEQHPTKSGWYTQGFTFRRLPDAEKKFVELVQEAAP